MGRLRVKILIAIAMLTVMCSTISVPWPALGQVQTNNAITDVDGILVGHSTNAAGSVGTTVVYAPDTAIGAFDVRGGWPITVETDLMDPKNLVQKVNAIVISGGGQVGLEPRTGVMRCLEERQEGFSVGVTAAEVVPIVPGAAINDVGRIGDTAKPTADDGYQACMTAADGPVTQGNVGAGTGAVAGGIKGGFGTASSNLGNGVWVGAAVAVGSYGRPWVPGSCVLHFARYAALGAEYGTYQPPSASECAAADGKLPVEVGNSVAVVATNFALSKAQAEKMAGIGQDGLARAITPSHTSLDGDPVFALSTGTLEVVGDCQANAPSLAPTVCAIVLNSIFAMAADTLSRAVNHAILEAQTVGAVKSYCDTFPSSCGQASAQAKDAALVGGVSGRSSVPDGAPGSVERSLVLTLMLLIGSAVLYKLAIRSRSSKADLRESPQVAVSHYGRGMK